MEEMNATVLEVAKNAAQAAENAGAAREGAREGLTATEEVNRAIETVRTRSEGLKVSLDALGERAKGIGAIMILGSLLEETVSDRARRSIKGLVELAPQEAVRLSASGEERTVPVAEIRIGDRVLVRPGERIPVDAAIISGVTAVDESAITGESLPRERHPGDQVLAGTMMPPAAGGIFSSSFLLPECVQYRKKSRHIGSIIIKMRRQPNAAAARGDEHPGVHDAPGRVRGGAPIPNISPSANSPRPNRPAPPRDRPVLPRACPRPADGRN